jgi:hypothetical protein
MGLNHWGKSIALSKTRWIHLYTFMEIYYNLNIFYCQIYTIGLNTGFITYMKFSPVSYKHRSDREHDG